MEVDYRFISENAKADVDALRLRLHARGQLDKLTFSLLQIEARQKTAKKLGLFNSCERFLYPTLLAAEQSTHQAVAAYHAQLIGEGQRVLDMTAGLGVDAFAIAMADNHVTAIELARDRFEALEHNVGAIQDAMPNRKLDLVAVHADSVAWLKEYSGNSFDAIFIDPARRDASGGRTYFFADCLPNVVENRQLLLNSAKRVYVKASPILDIDQALREMPEIVEIHIVSVRGECKEVLCVMSPDHVGTPQISVVDLEPEVTVDADTGLLTKPKTISAFHVSHDALGNNRAPLASTADLVPGVLILDPNAGLHKLHAADELCRQFAGLKRLDRDSDLYLSQRECEGFPGRSFRIESISDRKALKRLKGARREIISRNHPLTAEQLRRNFGLKSGSGQFLIATRVESQPVVVDATRL